MADFIQESPGRKDVSFIDLSYWQEYHINVLKVSVYYFDATSGFNKETTYENKKKISRHFYNIYYSLGMCRRAGKNSR